MIAPPTGTRVYLVAGVTDMRKGFDGPECQPESRQLPSQLN